MNEIRIVLVHLDASPRCAVRLRLAAALAARQAATLDALYAATSTALTVPYALGDTTGALHLATREADERHKQRARAVFDGAGLGPGVGWSELTDASPLPGFVRAALTRDLLVLGQPDPDDPGSRIVPSDFAEAVIIGSGKPAIVVPWAGDVERSGRRVLVAWKGTRESARALAAALPLLRDAEQVDVAGWGEDPREVAPWLRRHGIEPRLHREPPAGADVGELILSRAADFGADLLVMGCYGHGRARELVLGGASRTVLDSMTLPVLMAH